MQLLNQTKTQSYLDDIRLLLNFNLKDDSNAIIKSNKDLCRIIKWTFKNKLVINPNKTKLVICGSRALTDLKKLCWGKEISPVASAEALGVLLDST